MGTVAGNVCGLAFTMMLPGYLKQEHLPNNIAIISLMIYWEIKI